GLTRADGPLRLLRPAFPTFRPQPRNPSPSRFVSRLSARGCSRLRHGIAGSPRDTAESGSSTYGLSFHLQLLPTPPRDDAVTFDYWATTHPGADFHRASKASSRTHDPRFRGDDTYYLAGCRGSLRQPSPAAGCAAAISPWRTRTVTSSS